MADDKAVKTQHAGGQTGARALVAGDLVQATVSPDGIVTVNEALTDLKLVDVADIDLLLTFADGDHVVIPNGALNALGANPPDAVFSDRKISLADLFKMVGVANPAKAGSLRLVTENIDANPPPEENLPPGEPAPQTPPPAPMLKVGTGTGSGKGPGNGVGAGEGEGEVPITVTPMTIPSPSVFTAGKRTSAVEAGLYDTISALDVLAQLYGKTEFKVTPSGRSDLPMAAYDSSLTAADNLALHGTAAAQATVESIHGTTGNDTIGFNPAFSMGEHQWVKTLHVQISGFSSLSQIELAFVAGKIALVPGFDVVGPGVTKGTAYTVGGVLFQPWYVTPGPSMLVDGLNVDIAYNVTVNPVPVDFRADLIVTGGAEPITSFTKITNLDFTWRDAATESDFNVTTSTGVPMLVLPSAGVGVEIFAGDGNDLVYAGAGPDLVHGGDGNDTLNGGRGDDVLDGGLGADVLNGGLGSDTATYENAVGPVTATLDASLGISNTGEASGDTYSGMENLRGSNGNDLLIGDMDPNTLAGNAGDDTLVGGGEADTLDGGAGNDTASYQYATGDVTVSLASNAGTQGEAAGDVLISIENLTGGAGNDTLVSALGIQANTYDGRGGIDTVSYSASAEGVTATLTTGLAGVVQSNDAAGDTFTNVENLTGTSFDDALVGDAGGNVLNGGAGNGGDTLEGLGGADVFVGGAGNDTTSYVHSALGVTASLTTVFATGPAVVHTNDALGDTFSGIENLTGSAFNDTLIGDNGGNVIDAGSGDDVLEGMEGSDTLIGGSGNDTASHTHAITGVTASLTTGLAGFSGAGDAAGDVYAGIENLTGSAFNDTLIGDGNSNVLDGGTGDDVMEGLGGSDTLLGGAGSNTASYAHGADQGGGLGVTASLFDASTNTGDALGDTYTQIQNLTGSAFSDTLTGDANDNILDGGEGNDVLSGGLGADALYGGNGNDALTDDLVGAAKLYAGAGDDIISMTGDDAILDIIDGGVGSDTLMWAYAGSLRVDVNMQAGTVYFYGPVAGTLVSFGGIENFTAAGTNSAYVYANNFDNVITGGSTGSDYVDYRHALSGISANLATGVVTGGSGNDTLVGIEHLYAGSSFADTLVGNAQDNWIRGGSGGGDYLDGGAGRDTWYIDWNGTGVTASLLTAAQNAAMGIVMTGDAAGDTVVNFERIYSSYGDFLYGDAGHNDLYGRGLIEGFLGNDYIYGFGTTATASYANAGNSYLAGQGLTFAAGVGVTATLTTSFSVGPAVLATGDAAGDSYAGVINNLRGSAYADTLIGNGSVNALDGGLGDDVLEGMGGADVLTGSAGIDTVSYAHSTAAVVADLSGTLAGTNDAAGDQFFGIENLTGSNFNDSLYGDGNDNVLDGGLGTNLLNGGGGNDTASYRSATGAVAINLAAATVTGAGRTDTLVSIEQVVGSDFNDTITGSTGNDWIDAGVGADTVDGGMGIDTLSYGSATGGVTAMLNGANSQGDALSNFENLFGSIYGDILTGDGNNNVIEGGLGNDSLDGAGGIDAVSYAYSTVAINVNLSGVAVLGVAANSANGGAGTDTLANFENVTGSAHNDILIGDGGANVIDGGNGNDVLVGGAGAGADTLTGGNGTDTVSYVTASSAVAVTINGTGTLGDASGDVLSSIENLVGSAFDDTLTGDGGNNLIDGGTGNDLVNGAGGVDTVTYLTAASAVTVNLSSAGINVSGGGGDDTLTNIENIVGSAFNDTLTGDGGANTIEGGGGNDTLDGGGGVDTAGYDSAVAGVSVNISGAAVRGIAANSASGGAGSDTLSNFEGLTGSAYNDILIGGAGSNLVDGGAGDDILIGGAGADTLIGGTGADMVSYENAGSAVQATLGGAALAHLGDALGDTFSGVENLTGSAYNDILYGDSGSNVLVGGGGDDDQRGYDGNDTLDARLGRDTLRGGNGDDVFLVDVSAVNLPMRIYGEGNNSTLFGGGDAVKLYGLVSGQTYSLTSLANVTDTSEILDAREGVNNIFNITSADVRNFVDGGNGSQLWIKANSGDALNLNLVAGETMQTFSVLGGTDYLVFNASSTQVAQIHWQTA